MIARAFIILSSMWVICGCVEYNVDDNVHICIHTDISQINYTVWSYNNKVIALATTDKTFGYISSLIKRINISSACMNISSLQHKDSGLYTGVTYLKSGNTITTTMNISVKANVVNLKGIIRHITNNYCEVKIRCKIESLSYSYTDSPVMILGTLDRWKHIAFPTDNYRYDHDLRRYTVGNPYPLESLELEITATFNRFNVINNLNDDEFSCYMFLQNNSFHKMLNVRHLCESEWETINKSHMVHDNSTNENDLYNIMSQVHNEINDDTDDSSVHPSMEAGTLIIVLLITMISVIILIILVIATISIHKSSYKHIDN
ncbi:36kDa major membrane protein [Raccoonpox virus]|uniref:Major membrane protein n=1 Tax=Raccoon poxvirus TaxID=10256 RepID=A0A0G3G2G3_RACVI|nr:Major membrane protein [Raccoonpox virus]AKJ93672.1 Major membrane protein [Raccoonpox virus]AOP31303.1 36kDa major membrane protein [Raccoonpox virus]